MQPAEASADLAQAAIAEDFAFFGDWTERYQYLIDLGRKLPPYPDALKTDERKVSGCQSQVWLDVSGDAQRREQRRVLVQLQVRLIERDLRRVHRLGDREAFGFQLAPRLRTEAFVLPQRGIAETIGPADDHAVDVAA